MESFALRSGSSGNCIYIGENGRGLVIDAGINGKTFVAALAAGDVRPEQIAGIVITHEHSDHTSGLGVLLRRHRIPLYISEATLAETRPRLGEIDTSLIQIIEANKPFQVGDLEVTGVPIPHDAVDPMAYRVEGKTAAVSVCTDIGVLDGVVASALAGSKLLYIEANYDDYMLAAGTYSQTLKKRIRGRYGHLSNDDCGAAVIQFLQTGTTDFILSHLSQDNNMPLIALRTVRNCLDLIGAKEDADYRLTAAPRYLCSRICEF